jgi:signal transduction histidine kinase
MRSLYVRIWLTVVAALALFAAVSGWLVQRHLEQERTRVESSLRDRVIAWGELMQRSLPAVDRPPPEQAAGVQDWSERLRLPMALDAADGTRIATSDSYRQRESDLTLPARRALAIPFDDGRTLWVMRPRGARALQARGERPPLGRPPGLEDGPRLTPPSSLLGLEMAGVPDGLAFLALLALLFAAVAAGAWPVVRRLTRRLEALKVGVDAFGAGQLSRRVPEDGRDEVAALAASFNRSATRIEALMRSHQSLLANASHELRSPLARLKMALAMMDEAAPEQRRELQAEVRTNIAELDALVEEVLLASRLDARHAQAGPPPQEPVDLLGLAAEEGARVGADAGGEPVTVPGEERLLRRAVRNLVENARRYGGQSIEVTVAREGAEAVLQVADRGPGVPEAYRERIFEPFFRLPGHAEREGGIGLGLALVRQIAEAHRGRVACAAREGGGSVFSLRLPMSQPAPLAAG